MARSRIRPDPSHGRRWVLAASAYKGASMFARRTAPGVGGLKLRRRIRAGVRALREIKRMQESDQLLIPRAPFKRLIMELTRDRATDVRNTFLSYFALQTAAESYIINVLKQAYLITLHSKRATLTIKDIQLARSIMASTTDAY